MAELPPVSVPRCEDGKRRGKSLVSGAHIIGRQAQMIAMFSSIIVHTEEARSSAERSCKCLGSDERRAQSAIRILTGSVRTGR